VSHRRLAGFVLAAALVAGVGSVSAGAAPAQRPPGSPDLATMTLSAKDLPAGTRVVRERYYRDPEFVASYEREFSVRGLRLGRSTLLYAFNALNVETTSAEASRLFATLRRLLRTKAFRSALAKEIARGADIDARAVVVGRPRTARIGDGAVSIAIRLRTQGLVFQAAIAYLRVDRVLSTVALVGAPGKRVFAADVDRVSRVSTERIRGGLVPVVSAPPVVSGIPRPGQTLSTTPGTWTGDQLAFTYQWERCVEPGTGCAPIPGATSAAYTVVAGDLASSLRATVSGRNRLGSATTTSMSTAFVAGPPGAPGIVFGRGPVVEGVVGAGATLTATTGTWTGAPTSFAYQWRRCSPQTSACVDVAGGTSETYTLTPADSGSLMRVLVVATNDVGSGGALTPPSAPAP
jgi:hypothetical protein